jgi:hypothetical protein
MSVLRIFAIGGVLLALAGSVRAQNPFELPPRSNGPYEIRGVVVDANTGEPLLEVELSIQESAQPTSPTFEVIQSDANGNFRFANLAEGKYSVHASRQGYAEQEFLQHENFWTGIAVGPGKDAIHVRFPLRPSATIAGQVTDGNGDTVRRANLTLWTAHMENGVRSITRVQDAQTDDQGRYRFGHLLAGKYSVSIQATPWYSRYTLTGGLPAISGDAASTGKDAQIALPDVVYPVLYYPSVRDWHAMEWINLQAGQGETADFHLVPESSVHLQIYVGAGGSGQRPNAALSMEFPGGGDGSVAGNTAVSDSGELEISGIAAGSYRLQRAGGPAGLSGEGQRIDLSGSSELRLDEAPASGSAIRGVLRMEEGELTVDQAILQLKDAQGHAFNGLYFSAGGAEANPAGSFAIENVPAGPQVLELSIVQPQDFMVKKIDAKGAKVSGTTIETDGTQEVSLIVTVAQSSSRIEGTAMKNGKPFAGAMILLVPEDGKEMERRVRRDQSDSDGTFRLPVVLPGKYLLMALENGWEMEWSKPEVLRPFMGKAMKMEVAEGQVQPVVVEVE